jgi:translocation and assembly module TamB
MRFVLAFFILIWPCAALAQQADEDRGFVAGLLEGALGGEGRTVRIEGFAGALSSTATIDRITIGDTEGVWLTLEDVAVQWNRRALLRGAIEVEELRASLIDLPRLPLPVPDAAPAPEAKPFALPDLPASLNIGQMAIERVALGAPVLGEAADFSLTGAASLADGAGNATLAARRIDGPRASFDILASYANETRALNIDLDLSEAEDGLLSGLMNLPGRPSVELAVAGDGVLSDFSATLDLRTDGAPRLAGALQLQSEQDGPMVFDADLNGDVSALFLPEYAAFFGPDVQLVAKGNKAGSGEFTLDAFTLDTRSMRLGGKAALNSDGWPTLLDIEGRIADPDGTPVLLPAGGTETSIERADLQIQFDAGNGDAISGRIGITGLSRADVQAESATLVLDGTLSGTVNAIGRVQTRVDLDASGLAFSDPALAQAVGSSVRGGLDIDFVENEPLHLSAMSLTGATWALTGMARIDSLTDAFATTFETGLEAQDLSAFAALAGLELEGAGTLSLAGSAALGGVFDVVVAGETRDLAIGIPQADALLRGTTKVDVAARRDTTGTFLDRLVLANDAVTADANATLQSGASRAEFVIRLDDAGRVTDAVSGPLSITGTAAQSGDIWDTNIALSGPLDATAEVDASIAPDRIGIDLTAGIPEIGLLVPQLSGAVDLGARAEQQDGIWTYEANLRGPFSSTADVAGKYAPDGLTATYAVAIPEVSALAPGISGPVRLNGDVTQVSDGWQFDTRVEGPYSSTGTVTGSYLVSRLKADFDLALPDLSPLAPGISGPARVTGDVAQVSDGWQFATSIAGPYQSTGTVTGSYLVSRLKADFDLALPDVSPLAPGITGPARVTGDVAQVSDGWQFATSINGPYQSTGTVSGSYLASRLTSAFDVTVPDVAPLVPGVSGQLSAKGDVQQSDAGWALETDISGPYGSSADIGATYGEAGAVARYAVQIPNIGALVPRLNGSVAVVGTARQVARGFDIDAAVRGPAGTTVTAKGLIGSDGRLELDASGQAQLGLANPFLEPRTIAGVANFDLTVDGPPALSSVSGLITTQGTRFAAPNLSLSLGNLSGAVRLSGGQASLDLNAGVTGGGSVSVSGPITLSGNYPAQLDLALNNVVVSDPSLYTSTVNGAIGVNGALTGGARIAGTINVGETNIQVPSSGISSFGEVPDINHIGATRPVMRTRERAGVTASKASTAKTGPAYPLDITVNAPSRIFIRGRGIDAEVGGSLRLSGTSADTISTGEFNLVRGRLDILSKRFELDEGRVQLQGRFSPYLRFVAATTTSTGTARIIIQGPASDPTVTFESTPEAPQDQVLAQIFFGRDISQLSAFQALQLANAVATLAGRGGEGIVSRLRQGFNLDDLDVTSDEEGNTALRAGKYISDNVYTDVTVGGPDGPEVSLNIDLTPNITVRGSVSADSNTGIGIFVEKDY